MDLSTNYFTENGIRKNHRETGHIYETKKTLINKLETQNFSKRRTLLMV